MYWSTQYAKILEEHLAIIISVIKFCDERPLSVCKSSGRGPLEDGLPHFKLQKRFSEQERAPLAEQMEDTI